MMDETKEKYRLILAAEDCSPEDFDEIHVFSKYEEKIIRSLIAHGPVLIRGGRGSGKSALLIKAHNQIKSTHNNTIFSVYLSLRHLPLLRSKGKDYEEIFCRLLSQTIIQEIEKQQLGYSDFFSINSDVGDIQQALIKLSSALKKRVVLFFDDAAHIGRETSLAEFFDIFRTLSSSSVACKAAIYPGVTKFGIRFDVYNDATIIDITRDERMPDFGVFFEEVVKVRYPQMLENISSPILQKDNALAWFLGRSVAGNMRALVFACNKLTEDNNKIGLEQLTQCLIYLSSYYYWPLLEELSPKLGIYESLIEPSKELAEILFKYVTESDGKKITTTEVAASVLIHRDLVQEYAKLFEILEYTGFISRREVSRAMKSGGRGSRYILNLCNLLENTSGARLSAELFEAWKQKNEPSEIHRSSSVLKIVMPKLPEEKDPAILSLGIGHLKKSLAYPYGLTDDKYNTLNDAGFETIENLADASDEQLKALDNIGDKWIQRLRYVVGQAIWM